MIQMAFEQRVCYVLIHALLFLSLTTPNHKLDFWLQPRLPLSCKCLLVRYHLNILFYQSIHTCLFLSQDCYSPLIENIETLLLTYLLVSNPSFVHMNNLFSQDSEQDRYNLYLNFFLSL